MPRLRKVYLPKWTVGFSLVILVVMWAWVTWTAFFTAAGGDELGVIGWLLITLVFAALGAMLTLMGLRKLPAYLIEDPDDA